jgi:hypothetical protein
MYGFGTAKNKTTQHTHNSTRTKNKNINQKTPQKTLPHFNTNPRATPHSVTQHFLFSRLCNQKKFVKGYLLVFCCASKKPQKKAKPKQTPPQQKQKQNKTQKNPHKTTTTTGQIP